MLWPDILDFCVEVVIRFPGQEIASTNTKSMSSDASLIVPFDVLELEKATFYYCLTEKSVIATLLRNELANVVPNYTCVLCKRAGNYPSSYTVLPALWGWDVSLIVSNFPSPFAVSSAFPLGSCWQAE